MGVVITASNDVIIGQSFTVVAKVTNNTNDDHSYGIRLRGRAMLYTGITGQVVKSTSEQLNIPAGQCMTCLLYCYHGDLCSHV